MASILFSSDEAQKRINSDLSAVTPISPINDGSIGYGLINSMVNRLGDFVDSFNLAINIATPATSLNLDLDIWGELVGLSRKQEANAQVNSTDQVIKFFVEKGTFGDINNGEDISLLAGTRIYSKSPVLEDGNIVYSVSSFTTLVATDSFAYVSCTALRAGQSMNIPTGFLIKHSFTDYADSRNGTLRVINEAPIMNGVSGEDDFSYRNRIINRLRANDLTDTGIIDRVRSLGGVSDVTIQEGIDGLGTKTIFIQGNTPVTSSSTLSVARSAILNNQTNNAIKFYVRSPEYIGAGIDISIRHMKSKSEEEKGNIEKSILISLSGLINNLPMGRGISISRIERTLGSFLPLVEAIGTERQMIDGVYEYRNKFGTRSALKVDRTISANIGEKIVLEFTIDDPIRIARI